MMGKKKKEKFDNGSLIVRNKKALHEYEVIEKLECGIVLQGTEVKSLRNNQVNFAQSFAFVKRGQLVLVGLHIAQYSMGNRANHEPERNRKLLAHKREIRKLGQRVEQRGFSLVPISLYWQNSRCKVELAVVRGRQLHDKRNVSRERDLKRRIEREVSFKR